VAPRSDPPPRAGRTAGPGRGVRARTDPPAPPAAGVHPAAIDHPAAIGHPAAIDHPAVIDLGEVRAPGGGPGPDRRPPDLRALVAVLVVLALVVIGADAPPRRPLLVPVASVPGGTGTSIAVTAGELYVTQVVAGRPTLSGYRLPGGRLRWRVPLAGGVAAALTVLPRSGVLLAVEVGGATPRLRALDSGSGRQLWSWPGATVLDAPDEPNAPDEPGAGPAGRVLVRAAGAAGGNRLAWVDARSGRRVWSRPVSGSADVAVARNRDRGAGGLLVTEVDGTAWLLAEASGAVLATGQVGSLVGNLVLTPGEPGETPAPAGERLPVDVLGAHFLVEHRRNAGTGVLTGFDLNTLTRRWSLTGDLLGKPFPCGPLLCLGSAGGLRGVDGTTGTVRWSSDRWQYASPMRGGGLLAYSAGTGLAVLDPATGRLRWPVAAEWTHVLVGDPATVGGPPVPELLSRQDAGDRHRYWFAALAPGAPVLGYLTDIDWQTCGVYRALLACRTDGGRLGLWRFRGGG
jgi:PQQ-like domain